MKVTGPRLESSLKFRDGEGAVENSPPNANAWSFLPQYRNFLLHHSQLTIRSRQYHDTMDVCDEIQTEAFHLGVWGVKKRKLLTLIGHDADGKGNPEARIPQEPNRFLLSASAPVLSHASYITRFRDFPIHHHVVGGRSRSLHPRAPPCVE